MTIDVDPSYQLYHYTPTLSGGIIFAIIFGVLASFLLFNLIRNSKIRSIPLNDSLSYQENWDWPKLNNEVEVDLPHKNPFSTPNDEYENRNDNAALSVNKSHKKKRIVSAFIPLLIGLLLEFVGYICRILNHFHKQRLIPYAIQSTLLLVGPSFTAASIYMIFGRLLRLLDASNMTLLVPIKWLTTFFVCGDVLGFLLQGSGGGLMSNKDSADTACHLVIGGLVVQLVFLGFFIVTEIYFTLTIKRKPTSKSLLTRKTKAYKTTFLQELINWEALNYSLMVASILIVARCIVRLVEFIQGFEGYIIEHEVFMYTCDGLLLILANMVLLIVKPDLVLQELQTL